MIDDQHIKCLKCGDDLTRDSGYTCGCEYLMTISHIEPSDDERIIREALQAGPTPGPWTPMPAGAGEQCVARVNNTEAVPPEGVELAHEIVDVTYIAACSPDRIERVLAELERLREFERSAARTLPGVYYMDPPDGGDVSLLKQLQRMSIDAARYRLLRRKFVIMSDGNGNAEFYPINLPRPTYTALNTAIELDTAPVEPGLYRKDSHECLP